MNNSLLSDLHRWGLRNLQDRQANALVRPSPPQEPSPSATAADDSHEQAWLQSLLASNDTSGIYLTETLVREVFHHLAMNRDPYYAAYMPLILVLIGGFGVGKTTGLAETLRRCGCRMIRIDAAELESPYAGVPAQRVQKKYLQASQEQEETGEPCALLADDIHLAFRIGDNVTRTTNIDQAVATLMSFCDQPTLVGGSRVNRIPIFATANDLTQVYGGLIRLGRTRVVAIEPTEEERKRIAMHILRDILSPEQVEHVCAARSNWPIAGFRHLKSELLRHAFDNCHRGKTAQQILKDLIAGGASTPSAHSVAALSKEDVEAAMHTIDAEHRAKCNFTK